MGLVQSFFKINNGNNSDIKNDDLIEKKSELLDTLDDDCLRGIFMYLTLLDLSNVAEVCVRFNQHANSAFNAKYRQIVIIDENFELNGQLDETEAVLRNFGPSIHSMSIISTDIYFRTAAAAVQMINHQTTPALTELHLSGVDTSKFVENLRPIFMKLESFRLDSCTLTTGIESLFNQALPMLKKAQFNRCIGSNHSDLEKFIELNPKLKVLVIRDKCWTEDSIKFINSIGENLSNLEELELEVDKLCYSNNQRLQECGWSFSSSKLSSLKVLKLNCGWSSFCAPFIHELAKNKVPIEHLILIGNEIDDTTIKSVSQLKQIKILELEFDLKLTEKNIIELAKELPLLEKFYLVFSNGKDFSIDDLVEMVAHAKKLKYFELDNNVSMIVDENVYLSILNAMRGRPEENHLSINISSGEFNVPANIVSMNRHLLSIKINDTKTTL